MNNIYVLIGILIFFIVYFFLDILNFRSKSIKIIGDKNFKYNLNFATNYFKSTEILLKRLNFPYNLNLKKYVFIKYACSIIIFLISFANYGSITVPIILSILIFFSPDILIRNYEKSQNIKLIKELKNINTAFILKLSAYVPLKDVIKSLPENVQDKELKNCFSKFAYEYEVMNFDIKKPAEKLMEKLRSTELISFMNILIQSIDNGNLIENLEKFNATLELSYHKYLNSEAAKRMTYVIIGTVFMLMNIIIIAMYPIVIQVLNNLNLIFT